MEHPPEPFAGLLQARDVEYSFDDSITGLTQDDDVHVTFERGRPRRFDPVVGADGLHSNVRALAFGAEDEYLRHLGLYASGLHHAEPLGLDHTGTFYNAPGETAGMYSARQNTEAKAMFYFAADALRYDRKNAAQQKAILRKAFDNEGWEVPTLLDGLEETPDFYFDSISHIRMDRFTNGRIALVGDAGYRASPLSGMGTSLALVGAYVLAGELAEAHDHRTASLEYERQLRAFALKCQQQAVDSEKWFVPRTRLGLRLRNFNYRMMSVLPTGKFVSKMALKVANAIPLKDYQEHLVVQP